MDIHEEERGSILRRSQREAVGTGLTGERPRPRICTSDQEVCYFLVDLLLRTSCTEIGSYIKG